MKIGIDISQIVYSGTGVARYTKGLLNAILKYNHQHEWRFFFSSLRQKLPLKTVKAINNSGYILKQYRFPPTVLSVLWNKWHVLDMKLLLGDLDWFISSDWIEPPFKNVKKATIIHDLFFLKYPETVDWQILKTQSQRLAYVSQETDLILADSQSTEKDIVKLLELRKAKIKVLYPGVEIAEANKPTVKKVLARLNLKNNRFLLTVGKLEPRKNLERLIEAFLRLPTNYPLIIVGPKGWGSLNLAAKNVRVLGYLNDLELSSLYQSCSLFVYPSLYEGFGYPVLEAAKFGVPIACSNTSSLKELGQGISLQFDPKNVNQITEALKHLLENKQLAKQLGEKAKQKAQEFTWQKTLVNLQNYLEKYDYWD